MIEEFGWQLPAKVEKWRGRPGGPEWLDDLPRLLRACADKWSLRLQAPFEGSNAGLVLPVERADGSEAVLKLMPAGDTESEHEGDALAFWAGRGAVRLLDQDRSLGALLLGRVRPGTLLWEVEDDAAATRIAAGVLRELWRPSEPGHPFRRLSDEAQRWFDELPRDWEAAGGLFERSLLDAARYFLREFGPHQGEQVVLHQDFHGGNVLQAEDGRWLAIDPKPLVGEREFDCASLLRDRRPLLVQGDGERIVRRRLDILCDELALDRQRVIGWGIAHAIAWGISWDETDAGLARKGLGGHISVARWLLGML